MVTFDTMALIWGVQRTSRKGQEHMIEWTAALLKDLKSRGIRLALTAVSLGEYLAKFDESELPEQLAEIQRNFIVYPYDGKAAAIAAKLWQKHAAKRTLDRATLKADIQIVATAKSAGIGTIYSQDPHIKKIGSGELLVKEIPDPNEGFLFGDK